MPKKENKMNIPSTKQDDVKEDQTAETETQADQTTSETAENANAEAQATDTQETETQAEDSVKVQDTVQATVTQSEEPVVEVKHAEVNPSDWSISPTEDGIEARNNSTGETFTGTIAEFNAKMRG